MTTQNLKRKAAEHPTITIKKLSELYIVGGIGEATTGQLVFWYAVRRFPATLPQRLQTPEIKTKTKYIQEHRPKWPTGEQMPEDYLEFYKGLPGEFGEGSPEVIEKATPLLSEKVVIVPPTPIDPSVMQPQGKDDVKSVEELIKRVRQLVMSYPVKESTFTGTGYSEPYQADALAKYISLGLQT